MLHKRATWLIAAAALLALSSLACGFSADRPSPTVPPTRAMPTRSPLPTAAPTLAPLPTQAPVPAANYQDMIGTWLDPDTGTVTTIFGLSGGLAVDSVINPNRGGNELTKDNWDGAVLTWIYCVPGGSCVTTKTVSVDADSLYTSWSNDQGYNGETVFQRVAPTAQPTPGADMSLLVGRWLDPDTTGTVTTIVARNGGYAVESVMNPDRGVNELTKTSWENGVLTWTYCPEGMYCIVSKSVSVDQTTLVADWTWADGGNGGTTYFSRLP